MYFWLMFWKWLFIVSTIGFGFLSVWVIVWGIGDIQSLLRSVKDVSQNDDANSEKEL